MKTARTLMNARDLSRAAGKMADAVLRVAPAEELLLVGILRRGKWLARRMAAAIRRKTGAPPAMGFMKIQLYRDDLSEKAPRPIVSDVKLPPHIDGRTVVLVDDVLFSGRTLLAAVETARARGATRVISAVLVDRGHRTCDVSAEIVHMKVHTKRSDQIKVQLKELDGKDGVLWLHSP